MRLLISLWIVAFCAASNVIQNWTDENLSLLDDPNPEIHRLFLIYADWCGACRRLKPKFQQSVPKLIQLAPAPPLEVIQINLDKAALIGSRFRISHLPSLYHQIDGEFRKIDVYREDLEKYFREKLWLGTPTMGPLSPPRGKTTPSAPGTPSKSFLIDFIEDLGVSLPVFVLILSSFLLFIALFVVWAIWLYTDYKLNAHNFTEEAIKERVKFLRKQPEFKDEFDLSGLDTEDEDSGEESDTETENENVPLRGRRSSIKNRLK